MTPAPGLIEDVEIITSLDFEAVIPCEGTEHGSGRFGHVLNTAGAYIVIAPCCGPKVIQCAGRVSYMRKSDSLHCEGCATQHPIELYSFVPLDEGGL